jgi:hypothetical protein
MSRNRLFTLLAALALFPAAAQAQTTITACYVPKSGSVYRIQAAGAPDACKNGHVEFSWASGPATHDQFGLRGSAAVSIPAGATGSNGVACEFGEVVVSGGYNLDLAVPVSVPVNGPFNFGTEWTVYVVNTSNVPVQLVVTALCRKPAA